VIGKLLKRLFKKRWVMTTHAIYDFVPGSLTARGARWILSSCDKILALSNASQDELISIGLDRERVAVHVTWVNQECFRPLDQADCRRTLGLPDRFTVLFVGRLLKIKGVEPLLDVAVRHPEMTFLFVGHGEMEPVLKQAAAGHGHILYLGQVGNERLPAFYGAADVSVMPSQYSEGFGREVIEALSCGIPVICSDRGGIRDHVTDDVTIVVPPDAAHIEEALLSLYRDRGRLAALRERCRPFAVKHFGEGNATQLVRAYEADAGAGAPRP
jgi:glycosyltransferase involved in cell wall biosynthesis